MFIDLEKPSAPVEDGDCRLRVGNRQHVGLCVLSLVRFAKGDVLDHFSGDVGPTLRQHSLQVRPGLHISGTSFIGYLSHGCDPNCRLDMEVFQLVALRDIAPGELLTVDYAATEDVLFRQFACSCGAVTCRRWITGRAEEPSAEGRHLLERGDASKRP